MSNDEKMQDARERAREALDAKKGLGSRIFPTYAAGAEKDFKRALSDFKKIPQAARDKAAYDEAGYKKGGSVKSSASRRADGIASRGKTRGRMI